MGGNDTICGRGGDDELDGGEGDDIIDGGDGDDVIISTMGNTTVFSGISTATKRRAMPVVMTEPGSLKSISIYHQGGTGHVLLAVYADSAGKPGTQLGVTASTVINATEGWQTINLANPVQVSVGQKVWLAWVFENMPGIRYTTQSAGAVESLATWSAGMPASFGTGTTINSTYSIYVTYSTASRPEISVLGNGVLIKDNDATRVCQITPISAVGPGAVRRSVARSQFATMGRKCWTWRGLKVPTGFTLIEGLPASLAPGASDTFTVRLDTAVAGIKSGDISFATNDSDENLFNFRIIGTIV